MDRSRSALRALATPVTSAPNALAIWTAYVPTPPDAPLMRTFWRGLTLPSSRRSWRATVAETPTAAASSKLRRAGLGARWSSGAEAYSAKAPEVHPKTSSPGLKRATSLPTASTVPAMSVPGMGCFGRPSPVAMRTRKGRPCMISRSPMWMDAARTRTSTSPAPMPAARSRGAGGRPPSRSGPGRSLSWDAPLAGCSNEALAGRALRIVMRAGSTVGPWRASSNGVSPAEPAVFAPGRGTGSARRQRPPPSAAGRLGEAGLWISAGVSGRGDRHTGELWRPRAKARGTRMVGVAPPARPARAAEVRKLDTAGRAAARRGEARAEGHRRGRGHHLERVSAHASLPAKTPQELGETPPRKHTRGARSAGIRVAIWATPPRSVDAPFVELHERQSTAALVMSNGAPPAASGTTWSTVRSDARWAGRL